MKKSKNRELINFKSFFIYFLVPLIIVLMPTNIYALYSDLSKISAREPPYLDYDSEYNYCDYRISFDISYVKSRRWNNGLKKVDKLSFHQIPEYAEQCLRDVVDACWCRQLLPPPYYWKGRGPDWMENFVRTFFCVFHLDLNPRGRIGKSLGIWNAQNIHKNFLIFIIGLICTLSCLSVIKEEKCKKWRLT